MIRISVVHVNVTFYCNDDDVGHSSRFCLLYPGQSFLEEFQRIHFQFAFNRACFSYFIHISLDNGLINRIFILV